VRYLLTQRSFQSFLYLLEQCRDPHTATWLERRFGWTNLENYHGTGFFNTTIYPEWNSLLEDLIQQPPSQVIIKAKRRGRGHGGWSKNNPYLPERFIEFPIDIVPVSLVTRILAVREQISAEWVTDLDSLITMNDMILESYQNHARAARDNKDGDDATSTTTTTTTTTVFDRNADFLISNTNAFMPLGHASPLRKGSFDLLILLATQESVHRVLRSYRDNNDSQSLEWLREFYKERVSRFFDGNQEYGRADDFLEELLLTPPSVKRSSTTIRTDKMELMDPMKIAEDILRMRTEVARDWKEIMKDVPADHTELRKLLLTKQMESWGQRENSTTTSGESSIVSSEGEEDGGQFQ
jgi:hypothetical protein